MKMFAPCLLPAPILPQTEERLFPRIQAMQQHLQMEGKAAASDPLNPGTWGSNLGDSLGEDPTNKYPLLSRFAVSFRCKSLIIQLGLNIVIYMAHI